MGVEGNGMGVTSGSSKRRIHSDVPSRIAVVVAIVLLLVGVLLLVHGTHKDSTWMCVSGLVSLILSLLVFVAAAIFKYYYCSDSNSSSGQRRDRDQKTCSYVHLEPEAA